MSLQKAKLTILDDNTQNTDTEIEVLFNPKEYSIDKQTPWQEHYIQGLDSPAVQFVSGERKVLSMELFFDTSIKNEDVRKHTEKVEKLMLVDAELHRPPLIMFTWGKLKFRGVLEDLSQRFTLFKDDGTPIRAILHVVMRECVSSSKQNQDNPRCSADHTKIRKVEQGDTLASLAYREYQDPSKWRAIADANKIEDPSSLTPGRKLRIPPMA